MPDKITELFNQLHKGLMEENYRIIACEVDSLHHDYANARQRFLDAPPLFSKSELKYHTGI